MNSTFENRIKEFILQHFAKPGSEWEIIGSTDDTKMFGELEPNLQKHETAYSTIEGQHDLHYLIAQTFTAFTGDKTRKWFPTGNKDSATLALSGHSFQLKVTSRRPVMVGNTPEFGMQLAVISWTPGALLEDTNGISEMRSDLLSPMFRPSFDRYFHFQSFMTRIVEVQFS